MNVFVAGATGAIGRPLTRILVDRGYRVFAATRRAERSEDIWHAGAVPTVVDVFDRELLDAVLSAIKPDAIIHQLTDLSGGSDAAAIDDVLTRNARLRTIGTVNLVAAAVSAQVRTLIAQSIAWAYAPGAKPHTEQHALDLHAGGLRGVSVHGVAALEHAVLNATSMRGCVLRYGQLYGPGTSSVDEVGEEMPLHVEAAAWAAVLALEKDATGVYNVAAANAHVSTDRIGRDLGWKPSLRMHQPRHRLLRSCHD